MTPAQKERVAELFGAALEQDPGQRNAFVEGACDDEDIRAEVRSLLVEHEAAGTFMHEPVLGWIEPKSFVLSPAVLSEISDRYEVLGEAGHGGMAVVYRACDRLTGESVALKVLRPDAAGQATIERFKNELRLARKVTHKNVCRIHEFNVIGDTAYISMEFVGGESLREVLTRFGGVPLQKGIQVVSQICDGLREAHGLGIIHRDLKPENVMIDLVGNTKIMDFGIARSIDSGLTSQTAVIGTPAYMAPEQAEGKNLDARTDIYAVGLILYEMLTGRPTFKADTPVALAIKQVSEEPAHPRDLEATIPPQIEYVILRCLEKNPANRFQSVDELQVALAKNLDEFQIGHHVLEERIRSSRWLASTGVSRQVVRAMMLLALVVVSLVFGFLAGKKWKPAAGNATAINGVRRVDAHPATNLMHHDAEVYWLAFSPDGSLLASASEDKTIKLWNLGTGGETRTLIGHTRAVTSLAFSPDGRQLSSASSDRTLMLWDVATGQLLRTLRGHTDEVNSVAYSPDGHWLISGSADKTVRVWDALTGELKRTLNGHTSVVQAVGFSPDGKWIASAGFDETIRLWEALTGRLARILIGHADRVEAIAFSSDARWLASGADDKMIKLWDVSTGKEFRTLSGHNGWVNGLSFSPNGKQLASGSGDGTVKLWDVASGRQLLSLNTEGSGIAVVVFNPNATQIATGDADGNVKLWLLNELFSSRPISSYFILNKRLASHLGRPGAYCLFV